MKRNVVFVEKNDKMFKRNNHQWVQMNWNSISFWNILKTKQSRKLQSWLSIIKVRWKFLVRITTSSAPKTDN